MRRKRLLAAIGGFAILSAGSALAHPGNGGGPPAGVGGGMGNAGGMGAGGGVGNAGGMGNPGGLSRGGMSDFGSMTRDDARMNSQGPDHASPTGIAHANENSVLAGTTATSRATSGALSGLTTGTTLFSNGTPVGTVQQIRTNASGSVVAVVLQGTNGKTFVIPASKLSLNSGTLTTMARLNGINNAPSTAQAAQTQARLNSQGAAHASPTGIAHANSNSVLASGTTTKTTTKSRRPSH